MALNPLYSIDQLPTTDQAAIREFSDRYLAALGASKPTGWADTLGDLIPSTSPLVTFPVSQLRTKYMRTEGESRFKTLKSKSFDLKTEEFDDGYQAKLKDLFNQVFAYRRWNEAPARLLLAEEQLRHFSVAALLEAGESITCVDGTPFFGTTHPTNLSDASVPGTWGNYQATPKDVVSIANLQAEEAAMMLVKDENGNKFGVQPDTILCPVEKYPALRNLLAQQLILGAATTSTSNGTVNNPYYGKFNIIPIKEFTNTTNWYLVDSKLAQQEGFSPWASVRETVPESLALRVFDTNSDYFKNTGNIRMTSHVWYGFGLALPHAIRKVAGL